MSKDNPNAKDPRWNPSVDLPGAEPDNYPQYVDSTNGSALQNADKKSPDAGPPDYTLPGHQQAGQDEGRMRQPTTSAAGRIIEKKEQ